MASWKFLKEWLTVIYFGGSRMLWEGYNVLMEGAQLNRVPDSDSVVRTFTVDIIAD